MLFLSPPKFQFVFIVCTADRDWEMLAMGALNFGMLEGFLINQEIRDAVQCGVPIFFCRVAFSLSKILFATHWTYF
jgi:hypothetical protein